MPRSVSKGPFVDGHVLTKVVQAKDTSSRKVIQTWSRRSTIIPDMVGLTFAVHNGKKFIPVFVTEIWLDTNWASFPQPAPFTGMLETEKPIKEENNGMGVQINARSHIRSKSAISGRPCTRSPSGRCIEHIAIYTKKGCWNYTKGDSVCVGQRIEV